MHVQKYKMGQEDDRLQERTALRYLRLTSCNNALLTV